MKTGLTGETIGGLPVVGAVLLPRRGFTFLGGMTRRGWVDYEVPAFRCPWSPVACPAVLKHGAAFRSDAGETLEVELDANGGWPKETHCMVNAAAPSAYFVRPFTVPELPRRVIEPAMPRR